MLFQSSFEVLNVSTILLLDVSSKHICLSSYIILKETSNIIENINFIDTSDNALPMLLHPLDCTKRTNEALLCNVMFEVDIDELKCNRISIFKYIILDNISLLIF
jgi:hypothetical protein